MGDARGERVLDVRELEPPQPMVRVLAALRELPRGSWLLMKHRRVPVPLYPILDEQGFEHRTRPNDAGEVEVRIWHTDDPAPPNASP